jgi:hypothetical protein
MMLEIDHTWASSGSSGGLTPVYLAAGCAQSVLYIACSTLASSQSVSFQTAPESTGPWFTEGSTSISTALAQSAAIRVTGPYKWMRPYLHSASTGTYNLRLVATD